MSLALQERKLPPMLEEYVRYQNDYSDCLILMQVGDFYEAFFEDAKILARTLNVTLTSRDKNSDSPIPMAGIPCSVVDNYADRLLQAGVSVVIVSQRPQLGNKNIQRFVERIITPGVSVHSASIAGQELPYVGAIYLPQLSLAEHLLDYSLAYTQAQTGVLHIVAGQGMDSLIMDLQNADISELILPKLVNGQVLDRRSSIVRKLENLSFFKNQSIKFRSLNNNLDPQRYSKIAGYREQNPELKEAIRLLISYIDEVSVSGQLPFERVEQVTYSNFMRIDPTTRRNLELCQNLKNSDKSGTLFSVLNDCKTNGGTRLLQEFIKKPLSEKNSILERQEIISCLYKNDSEREKMQVLLQAVTDLDRILARIELNLINPRETGALRDSINIVPEIKNIYDSVAEEIRRTRNSSLSTEDKLLSFIQQALDFPEELGKKLNAALALNLPQNLRNGDVIAEGYDAECDRLRNIKLTGKKWIAELESKERERTGINSLKIKYNNVLGFFIEVTKSNIAKVPERFIKRQTNVNGERYITEELKNLEDEVLGAEQRLIAREELLFNELKSYIKNYTEQLRKLAQALSLIDVFLALASVARGNSWVLPEISEAGQCQIIGGRHPVIETLLRSDFIPNDLELGDNPNRCLILTGPNMGGKSTYLRQSALIVILAHIGSFVPADSANISLVDKIFARIGASDDLLEGESTFMVEMREAAYILSEASKNSLVLIDELGRGTSTRDGEAIARAVLGHLVLRNQSFCIFATHFHGLTKTAELADLTTNIRVGIEQTETGLCFTHRILKGAAGESYGIEVAKRAGLPSSLIELANDFILAAITDEQDQSKVLHLTKAKERSKLNENEASVKQQFSLFKPDQIDSFKTLNPKEQAYDRLKSELESCNVVSTTPLEALYLVDRLKKML
jgi:DNA mismatch repair protein MutS